MPDIHAKPFDEGTLAKLELFTLYTKEWLPVFLANHAPFCSDVHVFDFFAGEGSDSIGVPGSPLRILAEAAALFQKHGTFTAKLHLHFFDESEKKIARLREQLQCWDQDSSQVEIETRALPFEMAFAECLPLLRTRGAAKLVFIDQYGVNQVEEKRFRDLVQCPTTDFLFFISSSTLHRFREHPAMPFAVGQPDDYYHIHREVLNYFRGLLPQAHAYYLAPFSIKKGANIYGVIFGSAHLLGMDKFLQTAWRKDTINGEANFDINREGLDETAPMLPLLEFRPTKLTAFEQNLTRQILAETCRNEMDVVRICFEHGVTRKHAEPVLQRLKTEGKIDLAFRSPSLKFRPPRPIRLCRS